MFLFNTTQFSQIVISLKSTFLTLWSACIQFFFLNLALKNIFFYTIVSYETGNDFFSQNKVSMEHSYKKAGELLQKEIFFLCHLHSIRPSLRNANADINRLDVIIAHLVVCHYYHAYLQQMLSIGSNIKGTFLCRCDGDYTDLFSHI